MGWAGDSESRPDASIGIAAIEVATGAIHTQTTKLKRRVVPISSGLEFMNRVMADLPPDREAHVILDNYCIHKRNDP